MHLDNRLKKLEKHLIIHSEERDVTLEALELATSISRFDTNLNQLDSPLPILRETSYKCGMLLRFLSVGFYLVDEDSSDFQLFYSTPDDLIPSLQQEVEQHIEQGAFVWALERNRPLLFLASTRPGVFLLHSLATPSRIRGMFAAQLSERREEIGDITLSVLSIVLNSCAQMLESHALYSLLRSGEPLENDNHPRHAHVHHRTDTTHQTLRFARARLMDMDNSENASAILASCFARHLPAGVVPELVLETASKITESTDGLVGILPDNGMESLQCLAASNYMRSLVVSEPEVESKLLMRPFSENAPCMGNGKAKGTRHSREWPPRSYVYSPFTDRHGHRRGCLLLCNGRRKYRDSDVATVFRFARLLSHSVFQEGPSPHGRN